MTYTIYTMTLSRCSLMFETENARLICRYMPVFWYKKAYDRFLSQFGERFRQGDIDRLTDKRALKILIAHRINNLLPALYYSMMLGCNKEIEKYYEDRYGKTYKEIADLNPIVNEIERLKGKYKELFYKDDSPDVDTKTGGSPDFETLIINVELKLNTNIDRNLKVYQFKPYYDRALKAE